MESRKCALGGRLGEFPSRRMLLLVVLLLQRPKHTERRSTDGGTDDGFQKQQDPRRFDHSGTYAGQIGDQKWEGSNYPKETARSEGQ